MDKSIFPALSGTITKRRSSRSYDRTPLDAATMESIMSFAANLTPLYPDIRVHHQLIAPEAVKSIQPWRAPHYLAIYSEDKDGALENVGFMYQQFDLYVQSLGLGCCWVGLGRCDEGQKPDVDEGLEFVIMLAFGPSDDPKRSELKQFSRNGMEDITDQIDPRLEAARLAPSAVNSQPWYFTHEGDVIHAHCTSRRLLKRLSLGKMNRIDMGIALAHMYVTNPDTFRFFTADAPAAVEGRNYIGSFTL